MTEHPWSVSPACRKSTFFFWSAALSSTIAAMSASAWFSSPSDLTAKHDNSAP